MRQNAKVLNLEVSESASPNLQASSLGHWQWQAEVERGAEVGKGGISQRRHMDVGKYYTVCYIVRFKLAVLSPGVT